MNSIISMVHWWLPVGIIVVGVVFFIVANRQSLTTYRSLGLAVIAVGVLLGVIRYLVDTDQEKCERQTRALISAADVQDWQKFESILDAKTTIDTAGRFNFPAASGANDIAKAAQETAQIKGLERVQLVSLSSQPMDPKEHTITVSASVASIDKQDQGPFVSYWDFIWVPRLPPATGFLLNTVRLRGVGDVGG